MRKNTATTEPVAVASEVTEQTTPSIPEELAALLSQYGADAVLNAAKTAQAQAQAAKREMQPVFQKRPVPSFLLDQAHRNMERARQQTQAEARREVATDFSADVDKLAAIATLSGNWLASREKVDAKQLNARAAHARFIQAVDALRNAASAEEAKHAEQTARERMYTLFRHMPGLGAMRVPGSDATVKPANTEQQVLRDLRSIAQVMPALPLATLSSEELAQVQAEENTRRENRLRRLNDDGRAIAATLTGIVVDADVPAIAAPETQPTSEE